jgi:hypothetical protein
MKTHPSALSQGERGQVAPLEHLAQRVAAAFHLEAATSEAYMAAETAPRCGCSAYIDSIGSSSRITSS